MDDEKVQWTLDLIRKLQAANIGDEGRLDAIKDALEGGRNVYESDKNYLKNLHQQLQSSEKDKSYMSEEKPSRETKAEELLKLIKKLEQAEIGNSERLESIKQSLNAGKSLSEEESHYLNQKFEQLKKINPIENTISKALDTIEKLQLAEIGNSERLEVIKNKLEENGSLPDEEKSYLIEKSKQLKAIETHRKNETEAIKDEQKLVPSRKEIQRKRSKPVDPDAKYCAFCQRSIRPERDFSVAALVVLLFLGIIPGLIYYFLKAPTCPICKHSQWQIPPDDHEHA